MQKKNIGLVFASYIKMGSRVRGYGIPLHEIKQNAAFLEPSEVFPNKFGRYTSNVAGIVRRTKQSNEFILLNPVNQYKANIDIKRLNAVYNQPFEGNPVDYIEVGFLQLIAIRLKPIIAYWKDTFFALLSEDVPQKAYTLDTRLIPNFQFQHTKEKIYFINGGNQLVSYKINSFDSAQSRKQVDRRIEYSTADGFRLTYKDIAILRLPDQIISAKSKKRYHINKAKKDILFTHFEVLYNWRQIFALGVSAGTDHCTYYYYLHNILKKRCQSVLSFEFKAKEGVEFNCLTSIAMGIKTLAVVQANNHISLVYVDKRRLELVLRKDWTSLANSCVVVNPNLVSMYYPMKSAIFCISLVY